MDLTRVRNARQLSTIDAIALLLRARAFIALILVCVLFAALSPEFLTTGNVGIMSKHVAQNAILAIGMTFVILTAGIDLSVGSIVGLTAMVAGGLINEGLEVSSLGIVIFPHVWMVIVIALVVGSLMGAASGFIITRFGIAPFIVTLGMLYVGRGLAGLRHNGLTFPNLVGQPERGNTGFETLGSAELLGINISIWLMVVFALVAYVVTTRTPFGRHVYAIGGNERSAELSGVPVNRIKLLVYTISGFCAAMVGLIIASQLVAAHPMTGDGFELNAIAAVVLGGTSLAGGRGSIVGTIIGAFVIGVLSDGLILVGVSSFWQMVIKGLVIVAALIVDRVQVQLQDRIALRQQLVAA